jgi:hypothetical protein
MGKHPNLLNESQAGGHVTLRCGAALSTKKIRATLRLAALESRMGRGDIGHKPETLSDQGKNGGH